MIMAEGQRPASVRHYCRGNPRSGIRPHVLVRHRGGLLLMEARRHPVGPPRRGMVHRSMLTVLILITGVSAVLAGLDMIEPAPDGPCPARTSQALTDSHGTLRIRTENAHGTTLVHLCAESGEGAVTGWSARARVGGVDRDVEVEPVGDGLALTAVATPERDGTTRLTVSVRLASGATSVFTTEVAPS
ncbi:hypothetical protein [Actinoplanes rectilineatus]|uniref:hypothetical protein n=1 Tax=Actinoplanes rectilineatus TaxID=113571 RepID=UPI0012F9F919|nr:hypothetical protein [Actinoplanes rectilineatus]